MTPSLSQRTKTSLSRLLPAAFALAAAVLGTGCGAANDQVIAVVGALDIVGDTTGMCKDPLAMMAAGAACALPAMTAFNDSAIYDVGIAAATDSDLKLIPVITNRAMTRMVAGLDLNTIYLVAYDIELVLNPKLAVSAAIPATALKRTIPIASPLLGPMCITYLYKELSLIDRGVAKTILEAGVLNPGPLSFDVPPQVVTARLRFRYNQSGVLGVGNWFEYPVEFCQWCLALDPANPTAYAFKSDGNGGGDLVSCPPPVMPPAIPVPFGQPCSVGRAQASGNDKRQKTPCCKKDRSYFCGEDIPFM